MEAASHATVVEAYLYNRNIKAYDLKVITYVFGQPLKYTGVSAWKYLERNWCTSANGCPNTSFRLILVLNFLKINCLSKAYILFFFWFAQLSKHFSNEDPDHSVTNTHEPRIKKNPFSFFFCFLIHRAWRTSLNADGDLLLGASALLCSGCAWGRHCWSGAGRGMQQSWTWNALHRAHNISGFPRHLRGSTHWASCPDSRLGDVTERSCALKWNKLLVAPDSEEQLWLWTATFSHLCSSVSGFKSSALHG